MRQAFFITSFNDPTSAGISMPQFAGLGSMCDLILSDQSTDNSCATEYQRLCVEHGFRYIHNENQGASAAKRKIVDIALREGFTIIHQISEDFELVPEGEQHPAAPLGNKDFLFVKEATKLVIQQPHISFVNWTWFRSTTSENHGYNWGNPPRDFLLRRPHGFSLSHVPHDVSLMNWPYTGRVEHVAQLHNFAQWLTPGTPQQLEQNERSGGEWSLAFVSKGKGVSLYAHPVRHRDRVKPAGSLG